MLFPVDVLFLSKTLEQIDDDFLDFGQVLVEGGGRGLFSEGYFQTIPEVIWDVGEFTGVDANLVERLTGEIELGGELDKDIRDLVLSHSPCRPQCKALQELFGCHQKLGHCRFYRIHCAWVIFAPPTRARARRDAWSRIRGVHCVELNECGRRSALKRM